MECAWSMFKGKTLGSNYHYYNVSICITPFDSVFFIPNKIERQVLETLQEWDYSGADITENSWTTNKSALERRMVCIHQPLMILGIGL